MRRTATIAVTALLAAGLLAGCGDDGDKKSSSSDDKGGKITNAGGGDYCDTLKSSKDLVTDFTAASQPDFSKFEDFLAVARKLGDEAPAELKDSWKTMNTAMDSLTSAIKDAGISLEDFGKVTAGQVPDGVDQTKLMGLAQKLQTLNSSEIEKAGRNITDYSKDKCGVDLESGK